MSTKAKSKSKTDKLVKLVKANPDFTFLQNGKIQCVSTGHELMPTMEDFKAYLSGKAYKRAQQADVNIAGYERYLVDNKKDNRFFFCVLTGEKVLKKKSVVEKHLNGKRFQKKCKLTMDADQQAQAELEKAQNGKDKEEEEEELEEELVEPAEVQEESEAEQEEEESPRKVARKKKIRKGSDALKKNKPKPSRK